MVRARSIRVAAAVDKLVIQSDDATAIYLSSVKFLTTSIYDLPLSYRDAIVTYCRIQETSNHTIIKVFRSLYPQAIWSPDYDTFITTTQLLEALDNLASYPIMYGFISSVCRQEAVSKDNKADVQERIDKGIRKEFAASQLPDQEPALDYTGLLTNQPAFPLRPGWYSPNLYQQFSAGLVGFMRRTIVDRPPKIPHYQKRKNMGYETQLSLKEEIHDTSPSLHYTTLDLERLYHEHGISVPGPCEVRISWKSSQSKPRVYYATGGTGYFASRFIRELCNDLVDILPSTNRRTRYDVNRVTTRRMQDTEYLITYDYSSFTTTLGELKYFLEALSQGFKGVAIRLLDSYHGIISVDLGDLIEDYNDLCNRNAEFDISRVDSLGEIGYLYCQIRSGMLGVQGNIGFSTLLHGIHAQMISDESEVSCVGDDALIRSLFAWLDDTLKEINVLCAGVPDDKFNVWQYKLTAFYGEGNDARDAEPVSGYQYLKRPITISNDGEIIAGILPEFPNFAQLLGIEYIPNPSPTPKDRGSIVQTFCTQMSRTLYRISSIYMIELTDWETTFLLHIIRTLYDLVGLPRHGGLPGTVVIDGFRINAFVPPIEEDVFVSPWIYHLERVHNGQSFEMGEYVYGAAHAGFSYEVGETFACVLHKPQRFIRDLGYLEVTLRKKVYMVDDSLYDTYMDIITGKLRPLYDVTVLKPLPNWYNQIVYEDIDPRFTNIAGFHEICTYL